MLSLAHVNQSYGESHILWDVSFEVEGGSCTCLMGRNGVGKTTLLRTVMGLLPATSGTIALDGAALAGRAPEQRARVGIGYVPQGREIFPQLDVEENLRVGLAASGKREVPEGVRALFPVLKKMWRRRGGDLSGGQQQQLAIARALVLDPKLLILDEPTEGIQPNIVAEIGDILMRLNRERGLSVLLVEQKLPFARRVADRFVLMDRGRVAATGGMDELSPELVQRHLVV